MDQLKQVEVIRGPGSALYGSQAIGGVVAMETKDPSDLSGTGHADSAYAKSSATKTSIEEVALDHHVIGPPQQEQIEVMTSGTFRAGEEHSPRR